MKRYAVEKNEDFLTNTKTKEFGSLDEAILFETEIEAFREARKMSRAKVVNVILFTKGAK